MRVVAWVELKGCRILVGKNDGWIETSDGEISCHKPDLITRQLNVSGLYFSSEINIVSLFISYAAPTNDE